MGSSVCSDALFLHNLTLQEEASLGCLSCCFQAQPILYVRGASASWYLTHPPWTSDRGISSSACQRASITFTWAGRSARNAETFSKDHICRGKEGAMPHFLETCQGCHASHRFQRLNSLWFVPDKKSEWTCAAVKAISRVVWIATDVFSVHWDGPRHREHALLWIIYLMRLGFIISGKYLQLLNVKIDYERLCRRLFSRLTAREEFNRERT